MRDDSCCEKKANTVETMAMAVERGTLEAGVEDTDDGGGEAELSEAKRWDLHDTRRREGIAWHGRDYHAGLPNCSLRCWMPVVVSKRVALADEWEGRRTFHPGLPKSSFGFSNASASRCEEERPRSVKETRRAGRARTLAPPLMKVSDSGSDRLAPGETNVSVSACRLKPGFEKVSVDGLPATRLKPVLWNVSLDGFTTRWMDGMVSLD